MPDAAGGVTAVDGRNESYGAIVSDLVSLIEQVHACMKLVELAIASEAAAGNQEVADVVVLDDVTPRYAGANTALNTCNADLNMALHFLRDTGTSERGTDGLAGSGRLRLV